MSTPPVSPPLFQALPNDLDAIIVSFCDDQTILQMLKVCKAWNNNSEVQKAKMVIHENCWGKEEGFPLKLLAIFREHGFPISRLPELSFDAVKEDFRQRIAQNRQAGRNDFDGVRGIGILPDATPHLDNDYVDFLNTRCLSAPIMRFNHRGRPGLVMCLQDRITSKIGICTLFRRFSVKTEPHNSCWVEARVQHNDLRVAPSHLSADDFETLIPVLSGTDPDVRLIDPPPVSPPMPIPLPLPAPPAAQSFINRIFSFLYTTICDFFHWLYTQIVSSFG